MPANQSSSRVTIQDLERLVLNLNRSLARPLLTYRMEEGKTLSNVGNFHLSQAYGGVALHEVAHEDGAVRDVFQRGHIKKPELRLLLAGVMHGIQLYVQSIKGVKHEQ